MKSVSSLCLSLLFVLTSCTHTPTKVPGHAEVDRPIPYKPERTPAADELDWWAATSQQVQDANCRLKFPVTTAEIDGYYKKLPLEPGYEAGTTEVFGIKLENERPHLVLALSKLLYPTREGVKIEGAPENFQTKYNVNPSCKKALCAAQAIFGKEVGPQMLFIMDKFDVNTSPFSFMNADLFTASEIADVIRTFELIPTQQLPFKSNQQLIKFKRGYTRASYGDDGDLVLANAVMELFDGWSKKSSLVRQYTLFHEFAHNYANSQFADYDRSATWLTLSNWKESKAGEFTIEKKKLLQGHPFVSKYGETNPFEDFAESVTSYRLNPALLQAKSPDKYNLVKLMVFDGVEFTSQKSCKKSSLSSQYQKQIDRDGGALSAQNKGQIKEACQRTFYQTVLGHVPVSFFEACVNYEATQLWLANNAPKYPELVPQALFDGKLRISNLKFAKLKKELTQVLAPEATDWILDSAKSYTHEMTSDMTNAEYCEAWAKLEDRVYPGSGAKSSWRQKGIFVSTDYTPHAGAARGLCLDLVRGFTPTSKSSTSAIKKWLKETFYIKTEAPLVERGVNRESLLKYIVDRTGY
ncbi:MAG: hypothetical protein KUL82_03765 [Bdellovibrio sp.]|nr:hypothetical protein [Bdellovibrio sp.]